MGHSGGAGHGGQRGTAGLCCRRRVAYQESRRVASAGAGREGGEAVIRIPKWKEVRLANAEGVSSEAHNLQRMSRWKIT